MTNSVTPKLLLYLANWYNWLNILRWEDDKMNWRVCLWFVNQQAAFQHSVVGGNYFRIKLSSFHSYYYRKADDKPTKLQTCDCHVHCIYPGRPDTWLNLNYSHKWCLLILTDDRNFIVTLFHVRFQYYQIYQLEKTSRIMCLLTIPSLRRKIQ